MVHKSFWPPFSMLVCEANCRCFWSALYRFCDIDCLSMRCGPRVVAIFDESSNGVLPAKSKESDVRCVLVSDTHNVETNPLEFPEGDILLHAGDHTVAGTGEELERASAWLHQVAKRYKFGCIAIGGNHDVLLDTESYARWGKGEDAGKIVSLFQTPTLRLLHHEMVAVSGLTIFGSPFVPLTPSKQSLERGDPVRSLGFNRDDEELESLLSQIPHVDILMTHSPALGILDTSLQYGTKIIFFCCC
jgi:hypothetical protein